MNKVALVSGCLLGIPCKYSGEAASHRLDVETIRRLNLTVVPVCPEQLGGLPTPRANAEIVGGDGLDVLNGKARVTTSTGQDVTEEFIRGAQQVLKVAQVTGASLAILKKRSPSCSNGEIYDGTFCRQPREGLGVTAALLKTKTNLSIYHLEEIPANAQDLGEPPAPAGVTATDSVASRVRVALLAVLAAYESGQDWNLRQQESVQILEPLACLDMPRPDLERVLRVGFTSLLPQITTRVSDSDTVRFYREVIRKVMGFDILATGRHCRICTYPEGFLDTFLDENMICSACRSYQEHQSLLENYDNLQTILRKAIADNKGQAEYDAVIAFSGGKDSVYMLTQLTKYYHSRTLCVMDNLNQQTEQAFRNAKRAAEDTGAVLRIIPPPDVERDIRRNFLNHGESFCRLCLRSHFYRVYQVAVKERIPFVFFGLSPYQFLDCPNAIEWSLRAIQDISTPPTQRDTREIAQHYKHRAFQGGFDRGFIQPNEQELLQSWMQVYDQAQAEFVPLIVPFFLFHRYPGEQKIMEVIAQDVGWEKPETLLLRRTNCRWLRPAGIMHRAVHQYHLNYKERAAELRFQGEVMSEVEAQRKFLELNQPDQAETMSQAEFELFLRNDFAMQLADLPAQIQERLNDLL